MEFFDYADWIADGRRKAFAKGNPDTNTERLELRMDAMYVYVHYIVQLKTVEFDAVVDKMGIPAFSARFFNMLSVEGQV